MLSRYHSLTRLRSPVNSFVTKHRLAATDTTAGIIIIGNEIIKGHVPDTNSHFLAQKLYSIGVKVRKISVVSDNLVDIASEVAAFSKLFTHVITAGGVGPTEDDRTYQGIAIGLQQQLVLLPELVELILSHFPIKVPNYDPQNPPTFEPSQDFTYLDPALKMALVPSSSRVHFLRNPDGNLSSKIPLVQTMNVLIFPGIPQLLKKGSALLDPLCRNRQCQFYTREIYLKTDELSVAPILNAAVKKFENQVIFGSYPVLDNNYYSTRIVMESTEQARVDQAGRYLSNELPAESVAQCNQHGDPLGPAARQYFEDIIKGTVNHPLKEPLVHAFKVVEECLSRYQPSQVCVSFNGGKDCSALLHMIYVAWKKLHPRSDCRLQAMYIRGADPFPEMEHFIEETRKRYDLDLWTVAGPIRSGLTTILNQHPHVKAVLMGTRRSDPNAANLQAFQMTDPGWPSITRVSPILDWSYQQVWTFLRHLGLPYCSLYDKGYTSIGNRSNTKPNPALRLVDDDGKEVYRPAYFLRDGCLTERQGRL